MKALTLREARQRRKMTQDVLAAKSGIDQTTISDLETGRNTNPRYRTIEALAKALGIAPSRLRFSDPEPAGSLDRGRDRGVHGASGRTVVA
jgi:transcriptional regulator with XRE-family HTH domain